MQPPMEGWRAPVPSDETVIGTHVDAALAKASCAQLGYFQDRWTELLIRNNRPQPRSPLIHRGYYSRVEAVRRSLKSFLQLCPRGHGVQIVNLGVGLDTLYFWLREDATIWRDDLVYFEVDFPEVLAKKLTAVLKRQSIWPLLDATKSEDLVATEMSASGTRQLHTPHCRYVSADMRIASELASAMSQAGFRDDTPTLFLAECVLVYMQALHGDGIIEWASSSVPKAPSAMVVYEQTNPNDPFGKVMVNNLMQRGCPLLSIHEYPSLDGQRKRYMDRGWEQCSLADMNEIYSKYLDRADVERIQRIELMDEFEEWHLIQAHYFLLIATRAPAAEEGDANGAGDSWVHKLTIVQDNASGSSV
jgi:tRNA wybutosine-synthesizing protein 4